MSLSAAVDSASTTVDLNMLETRQKEGMSECEEILVREYLWIEYGHLIQVY